ncbi:siderophore-interacting protein [Thalassospira sp.]|uniref:siderophore-interacting protein n=1 Tax=Thalassospira sp. TaxID=1912094 RepID=UPI002734FA9C|nr:siderophore-interacting protein [Thalassospira sp.]MDP2697653.1 siderophore-interacting protein [Thalassospira sp.]
MTKPAPRTLTVIRKAQITPNMLRITLGGDGMAGFPDDQGSAYVKLILPQSGDAAATDRPVLRTYTVRHHRPGEIDIDFVLHGDGGPASRWAGACAPGDTLAVGGPGPKKLVDNRADWFLIVGDMTALPAISVNIEQLPPNAKGHAVIEILAESDIQKIAAPQDFHIHWKLNPHPGINSDVLIDHVKTLPWPDGRPSVWVACEFSSMRKLRDHLCNDRALDRDNLYISSYWKLGSNEEKHKVEKRADAERAA